MDRLLPVAETMLFGNQAFYRGYDGAGGVATLCRGAGYGHAVARRAALIHRMLDGNGLRVLRPEAGMFTVVDVRATGLSGEAFARGLLEQEHVAVMPGESFGDGLAGWLRVSLTRPDDEIAEACRRIAAYAGRLMGGQ